MARLCNTLNQPDPEALRERVVRAIHEFEQRVRDQGLPLTQIHGRIMPFALASTT